MEERADWTPARKAGKNSWPSMRNSSLAGSGAGVPMASRADSHASWSKGVWGARAGGGPEGHGEVIGETRT